MLTSAHCVQDYALSCTTVAAAPFSVTFAEPGGGWSSQASYSARSVPVQGIAQRPELFDLGPCSASDTFHCGDSYENVRKAVDHSKELVVLYLADEAPADAAPLPVMINANVDSTHSAAEVGIKGDLVSWVNGHQPLITTAGYGVGSHAYTVGSDTQRGRDYGVQRWVATSTSFGGALGAANCNASVPSSSQPGVVASPDDLSLDDIGDPDAVAPGTQYPGSQQSHSGRGDSGGPALVGQGPASHGIAPDPLPAPSAADVYDPARNYVVGTASLWVSSGSTPRTAFTPTWTEEASEFLMSALHDEDLDGHADAVDDDNDNDTCDDDEDQHPDDHDVSIGTVIRVNCSPSHSTWFGDESLDVDGDRIPNCADDDDDGDGILDQNDSCPVHASQFCVQFGPSCPWGPLFVDCRLAGCNDLLIRISSVINPDPTRAPLFRVLASEPYVVTVAPPTGTSIEQAAQLLAGAGTRQLLELEVVERAGRVRGSIAAYDPANVRIGSLRGATALQLRLARDGSAFEVLGVQAPRTR
jgi:hypothetical protein